MKLDTGDINLGRYKSPSQRARWLTEQWTHTNVVCPSCGGTLHRYQNNQPVADFLCRSCAEIFELKSTSSAIRKSVPDGAYATMMARLSSDTNPSLFILQYDSVEWFVLNLLVIPKYYFTPSVIRKRPPLSPKARRAGWTGCNILLDGIPRAGRIPLIVNRIQQPLESVLAAWRQTKFLNEIPTIKSKSWLLKTMSCIDQIAKTRFKLEDLYAFESELRDTFPNNRHIKEKLRQQLQVLRDRNYLRFIGSGRYELNPLVSAQSRKIQG